MNDYEYIARTIGELLSQSSPAVLACIVKQDGSTTELFTESTNHIL